MHLPYMNGFGYGSRTRNNGMPNGGIGAGPSHNRDRHHQNDSPRHDSSAHLSETNLYIRGLDSNCTDDQLRSMCEEYGTIVSTKAIMDKATNQCKGYGFVDFESAESASNAVRALNERNIQAQMAKQQEQDPTNLYIANLPLDFTEEKLETLLHGEGTVISTRILRNQVDGSSRGVGFARMTSKENCDNIIQKMNGTILDGSALPLLVKLADSGRNKKRSGGSGYQNGNSHLSYSQITGGAMDAYQYPMYTSQNGPSSHQEGGPAGSVVFNPQNRYAPQQFFLSGAQYGAQFIAGPPNQAFGSPQIMTNYTADGQLNQITGQIQNMSVNGPNGAQTAGGPSAGTENNATNSGPPANMPPHAYVQSNNMYNPTPYAYNPYFMGPPVPAEMVSMVPNSNTPPANYVTTTSQYEVSAASLVHQQSAQSVAQSSTAQEVTNSTGNGAASSPGSNEMVTQAGSSSPSNAAEENSN
ncbi:hypothetical protein L596_018869 [Steinernema carpocapsae]|uniref:Protein alan shepard n=1 Tax=Steinernema carpocapsae TaxID=34508 RepID=A0A4U5N603_STECR|nr:hypothetical protein L596_018869 [Steinernema carpocapsae]